MDFRGTFRCWYLLRCQQMRQYLPEFWVGPRSLTSENGGRTMAVREMEDFDMSISTRARDKRLEVRTTLEERNLIDRAVDVVGTDLTSFVVTNLVDASRQVLADRDHFALKAEAAFEWDKLNEMPARDLAGLRRLMNRPSPFSE